MFSLVGWTVISGMLEMGGPVGEILNYLNSSGSGFLIALGGTIAVLIKVLAIGMAIIFAVTCLVVFLKLFRVRLIVRVHQGSVAVIERSGAFRRVKRPGTTFLIPLIETAIDQDLRVQTIPYKETTRTSDGQFVTIVGSALVRIPDDDTSIMAATYQLSNPMQQVKAYVQDWLRTVVIGKTFDELYSMKSQVADDIVSHVAALVEPFGYKFESLLITEIIPQEELQQSMTRVLVADQELRAARTNAQAQLVLTETAAEAQATASTLAGIGQAAELAALADGIQESLRSLSGNKQLRLSATGAIVALYEYLRLRAMAQFAASGKTNAIVVPNQSGMSEEIQQVAAAILTADNLTEAMSALPLVPDGVPAIEAAHRLTDTVSTVAGDARSAAERAITAVAEKAEGTRYAPVVEHILARLRTLTSSGVERQ